MPRLEDVEDNTECVGLVLLPGIVVDEARQQAGRADRQDEKGRFALRRKPRHPHSAGSSARSAPRRAPRENAQYMVGTPRTVRRGASSKRQMRTSATARS